MLICSIFQINASCWEDMTKCKCIPIQAGIMKLNCSYMSILSAWPYSVFAQSLTVARILLPFAIVEPLKLSSSESIQVTGGHSSRGPEVCIWAWKHKDSPHISVFSPKHKNDFTTILHALTHWALVIFFKDETLRNEKHWSFFTDEYQQLTNAAVLLPL